MKMTNASHGHSFANKSWAELCDEEDRNKGIVKFGSEDCSDSITRASLSKTAEVHERKIYCTNTVDLFVDEDTVLSTTSSPTKLHSSYANVLKYSSPNSEEISNRSIRSDSPSQEGCNKKLVKREIQKDFLQDDLSLTSHLDVFHMQSPCKGNGETERIVTINTNESIKVNFPKIDEWAVTGSAKRSPATKYVSDTEQGRELRNGKRRMPLKQVDSEQSKVHRQIDQLPDDVLMPSPSKMIRSVGNTAESTSRNSFESRKRHRENYSSPSNRQKGNFVSSNIQRDSLSSPLNKSRNTNMSPSTKRDSFSSPSNRSVSEVAQETDPAVLSRRQKQIDYGKNTVGYERYMAEVSKDKREKIHPKTPPRHIRYSRRAWDGLIKNWRRRLHYWDPVSEGGGNPEFLLDDENEFEADDYSGSESYSLPNSVPSTPQQDTKRQRGKGDESFDFELNNDFYVSDTKCDDEEDFKPLDE